MRRIVKALFVIVLVAGFTYGACGQLPGRVTDAKEIVWFGLDFSQIRLIGSSDFLNPYDVCDRLFNEWNLLFVKEQEKYNLEKIYNKKVIVNIGIVSKRNSKVDPDKIVTDEKYALERSDLTQIISEYEHGYSGGIGLVFIMESLNKSRSVAYAHLVFYDLATNEILYSDKINGIGWSDLGIRNFWARAIYNMLWGL